MAEWLVFLLLTSRAGFKSSLGDLEKVFLELFSEFLDDVGIYQLQLAVLQFSAHRRWSIKNSLIIDQSLLVTNFSGKLAHQTVRL